MTSSSRNALRNSRSDSSNTAARFPSGTTNGARRRATPSAARRQAEPAWVRGPTATRAVWRPIPGGGREAPPPRCPPSTASCARARTTSRRTGPPPSSTPTPDQYVDPGALEMVDHIGQLVAARSARLTPKRIFTCASSCQRSHVITTEGRPASPATTLGSVASVLSVNLARVRANPDAPSMSTGIDKVATDEAVIVRPPGPMRGGLGSGLVGDTIGNQKIHGGDDQAVYVYAREDLDGWESELSRSLTNGMFGENLTTSGVEVTEARIGERWRIGADGLVLEVSAPRIPVRTSRHSCSWTTGSRRSPRRRNPVPTCGLSPPERFAQATRSPSSTAPNTT